MKQIEQNAQNNVCKVLVGNKCDKAERTVSTEEGAKLAEDFNMKFFETSAKSNLNVNETFTYLTQEILKISENKSPGSSVTLDKDKKKKGKDEKGKCCK
jgi:GTPase SAR1 family protein